MQTVTESQRSPFRPLIAAEHLELAMSVIRMVKLFGWESKMNQRIADKREEELTWVWKRQLLDLLNGNIKYVPLLIYQCRCLIGVPVM